MHVNNQSRKHHNAHIECRERVWMFARPNKHYSGHSARLERKKVNQQHLQKSTPEKEMSVDSKLQV